MVKVFISGIDGPFGHNLSNVLSQAFVGFRQQETGAEDESPVVGEDEEHPSPEAAPSTKKEKYIITGSFSPPISNELHGPVSRSVKPGNMIETGDRKKDAARRDAIDKIPIAGVKAKSVSAIIPTDDKEELLKGILDADIIILDSLADLDGAAWVVDTISEMCSSFEKPKTIILMSTIMTWAKTKVDSEDPEATIPEDEYRRRKPHPNFKAHAALEKAIVKHTKKEKFKGYVIAPGLVFHAGDSIFHNMLKIAWHNETLTCYGDGTNILPCIHLDDLITCTVEVIEAAPDARYILAVDDSKSTLYDIVKAISDNLSNGIVTKLPKENAFLDKFTTQQDYDMLTVNLRLEPGWIKEASLELKYELGLVENCPQIVQEYRDSRGFWALNVLVHGPPASGKTFFAQKIANHYKLHYLELEGIVAETIATYERRINGGAFEGEEVDIDGERSILNELKETIKANGKLSSDQLVGIVRDKLKSMPCKNQGYVLDGFPTTVEEAAELFKPQDDDSREDGKSSIIDDQIGPEFLFTIDVTDAYIKQRIMKLSEFQVTGTRNTEEGKADSLISSALALSSRLEEYRRINTDDLTVLNFFDEAEIPPIPLNAENRDSHIMFAQICLKIGEPRNCGKSQEQLLQESKEAELKKKMQTEILANEEREKREKEEIERLGKVTAEWNFKLENVKKQERETLETQSEPLRNYLLKFVMPTLTAGLMEVVKVRPADPIDYLAEFIFKNNPNNNNN